MAPSSYKESVVRWDGVSSKEFNHSFFPQLSSLSSISSKLTQFNPNGRVFSDSWMPSWRRMPLAKHRNRGAVLWNHEKKTRVCKERSAFICHLHLRVHTSTTWMLTPIVLGAIWGYRHYRFMAFQSYKRFLDPMAQEFLTWGQQMGFRTSPFIVRWGKWLRGIEILLRLQNSLEVK